MRTSDAATARAPRPWWFRLGAWIVALCVVVLAIVLIVSRSSYGTTEHTWQQNPLTVPPTAPAAILSQQTSYAAGAELAGPVVLEHSADGVDATSVDGQQSVWSYHRPGKQVCASHANLSRLILLYANGDRCNEAVALELSTGKRAWSRTIEAVGQNTIVWDDGTFLSVDKQKVILYEQTQGYERFTYSATDTSSSGDEASTCEQLDAAGTVLIGTLQRCRSGDSGPWVYQVVLNRVNDGKPLEMGRTTIDVPDAELLAVLPDGTSVLRSGDTLYTATSGAPAPTAVAGLTVADDVSVAGTAAGAIVTSGQTAYALLAPYTAISWTRSLLSEVDLQGTVAHLVSSSGLETIDLRSGQTPTVSSMQGALPAVDGLLTLQVSGPYVAIGGCDDVAIFE